MNDYLDRTVRGQELIVALILIVVVLLTIRALIPLLAWIIVLLVKPTIWGSERAGLLRRTEEPTVIERLTL